MKPVISKYTAILFVFVLLFNTAMPFFSSFSASEKEISYKELSTILGKNVYICDSAYLKGGYFTSFERLNQEQQQKLKKHIDIASSSTSNPDSKYINNIYSAYIAAIQNGSIKPFDMAVRPEYYQLSLKFSTAPPHIS